MEIDSSMKERLRNENSEWEGRINSALLNRLALMMVKEEIPHAYAEGFKSALIMRVNLKKMKKFDENQ